MCSLFGDKEPLNPGSLTQRPYSVRNNDQTNNRIYEKLEPNSFKIEKRKDFFSLPKQCQNKTFYNERKNSDIHPLDFYTKGKIPSKTMYKNIEYNKGIKSTSNDIIIRNALSINTKKFNGIELHKNLSSLYEQNITENNYMEPIQIYKTYEKYKIPKYATNKEIYKIMKEKYFAKDIHSSIAQGKYLSEKEFLNQKAKLTKIKNEETKIKNRNEKNIKKEEIKEINKSLSHNRLIYKDPNDYSKQILRSNTFYFDKNSNQMLKPKKWIAGNKK